MRIVQTLKELLQRLVREVNRHMKLSIIAISLLFTAVIWSSLTCNGLYNDVISAIGRCHINLYSVIASISGSLLGFSLASVSIIIAIFDKVPLSPKEDTKYNPVSDVIASAAAEDSTQNPFIEAAKKRPSKLQVLKSSTHYQEIHSAFIFSAKVLAITTVTSILGLIPSSSSIMGKIIILLLSFFVLLSILNVLWCITILESIVKLSLEVKTTIQK